MYHVPASGMVEAAVNTTCLEEGADDSEATLA
jgi:hypothetical protein